VSAAPVDDSARRPPPAGFARVPPTSPFAREVGPFYERIDADGFTRAFWLSDKHGNVMGFAHGGVIMSFADMLLARALSHGLQRNGVTVRMVVEFLAPAKPGEWLEGRARVVRAGKTLAFVEGEGGVGGRAVFTAAGTFRLTGEAGLTR